MPENNNPLQNFSEEEISKFVSPYMSEPTPEPMTTEPPTAPSEVEFEATPLDEILEKISAVDSDDAMAYTEEGREVLKKHYYDVVDEPQERISLVYMDKVDASYPISMTNVDTIVMTLEMLKDIRKINRNFSTTLKQNGFHRFVTNGYYVYSQNVDIIKALREL